MSASLPGARATKRSPGAPVCPGHLSLAHPIALNHRTDSFCAMARAWRLWVEWGLLPPSSQNPRPPTADQQVLAHSWLDKPGWEDSRQQQNSVTECPDTRPRQLSHTRARVEQWSTQLPAPRSHGAPGMWSLPAGCTVWRGRGPCGGAQRGILLGFGTRRLCCLVCLQLTEPDCSDSQGLSGWTKIAARGGKRKDDSRRLSPSRSRRGSRA